MVEFPSFDGGDDAEHTGVDLVGKSRIYVMRAQLFFGAVLFDRAYTNIILILVLHDTTARIHDCGG